jgi:CHAT domain-containing protein
MQAANIVHLACHGVQDVSDATQSGFCLGDGRLTIPKIMELRLDNVSLAFLSACETAKGDQNQPDQVMHLAAAMLFSGFKSVVATMCTSSPACNGKHHDETWRKAVTVMVDDNGVYGCKQWF